MILFCLAWIFFALLVIGLIGGLIYASVTEPSAIWSAKFFVVEFTLLGLFLGCTGGAIILWSPSFMQSLPFGLVSLYRYLAYS